MSCARVKSPVKAVRNTTGPISCWMPCVIVSRSWTVTDSASTGGRKRSSGTYAVIGAPRSRSPRSASATTAVAVIALVVEAM